MSKAPIAGSDFIPTSNPGERLALGTEQHHEAPDTKPSAPYETQWVSATSKPSPIKSTQESPKSLASYDAQKDLSLTDKDVKSSVTYPEKQK